MTIPYGGAKQEARDILRSEQERIQRLKAQQDALRRIRREEAKEKQTELARIEEQNQSKTTPQTQPDPELNVHSRPKRSLVIGRSSDKEPALAEPVIQPIAPKPRVDAVARSPER